MVIIKRNLTEKLISSLEKEEISIMVGPRQAGKTTILHQAELFARQKWESVFFLNLEDPDYLSLLNQSPKNLFKIINLSLNSKSIIFIDEVQYLQNPSNFLKFFFDEYRGKIKLVVSGSSAFYLDRKFKDSLAGRKIIFQLLPLSPLEFINFRNEKAGKEIANGNISLVSKEKALPLILEYMTFGGYPRVVLEAGEFEKKEVLRDICYSYIKKDIFESSIRQEEVFYKLFKVLSSQVGNLTSVFELSNVLEVSKTLVENYLYVMEKSFHVVRVKPFYKSVRKELTKMPKVFFLDLGLRNFLKNDFRQFFERDDKGQLFENFIFRLLLEKIAGDDIKFWRTTSGHEVDFVLKENQAFEVKVDAKNVKLKEYKEFTNKYPAIKFDFVSLEGKLTPFELMADTSIL